MTKFEVEGIERSVDIRNKPVPCLSAVAKVDAERGVGSWRRGVSHNVQVVNLKSTFDGVDALFPEDLTMLEGQNAPRKDGLKEQTLDVV